MQKEGDRSYLRAHERASGNAEGGRQVIFKGAQKGVWECRRSPERPPTSGVRTQFSFVGLAITVFIHCMTFLVYPRTVHIHRV